MEITLDGLKLVLDISDKLPGDSLIDQITEININNNNDVNLLDEELLDKDSELTQETKKNGFLDQNTQDLLQNNNYLDLGDFTEKTLHFYHQDSLNTPEINKNDSPYNTNNTNQTSHNLLSQSFGWLGDNTDLNNSEEVAIRCNCPLCQSQSSFADTNTSGTEDITPQEAATSGSGDYQIDGIISPYKWGFSWGNRQINYSFYESSVFNGTYNGSETGVKEVSEAIKTNVRSILNWIENIINIDFVEVTETSSSFGRMRFMLSNGPNYAYAYYPVSDGPISVSGDVHLNPSYDRLGDTNGFQHLAGKHGYMSLVHEIGHTLGLKHPHDGSTTLPSKDNNTNNTVMTYNFAGNSAGTFMPYDIKALQYLYGAKSYNSGDNTYQFTTRVDQFSLNGQLSFNTTNLTKQTIWDSAGVDTLDFSNLSANTSGYRFDLNPGGILTAKTAYNSATYSGGSTSSYGTAIAYNVFIENLVNSTSNDEIFANSVANIFSGYNPQRSTGQDILWNTNAQDTLDLSSYSFANVTQTQSGTDLLLGLGTNGSITLKNYFAGEQLKLLFGNNIGLSLGDVTVDEASGNAIVTVNLSSASNQTVSVNYNSANGTAIAGSDYTAMNNGLLTFNPGETSKTITVGILNDTVYESTENFLVNLSNASNATITDGQGIVTILDDDPMPSLSVSDVTVDEASGNATLTVNLSCACTQTVSVNYNTANGTAMAGLDYNTMNNGLLTFNPGEISKTFTISLVDDTLYEPGNEDFFVNLSNVSNANINRGQGIVTILDDDLTPSLSLSDVTVDEASGNAIVTVNLSSASNQTVSVNYNSANGTAIAGSDYTAISNGLLTFNPGETSKTLTVNILNDRRYEPTNETFLVNLSNSTNATITDTQGVVRIVDNDSLPVISINDVSRTEGNIGATSTINFQFNVTLSNPSSQKITVKYATANDTAIAGSDYITTTNTLIFKPGETSKPFNVKVYADKIAEANETFLVNLTNPTNATIGDAQGIGTIINDDAIASQTNTQIDPLTGLNQTNVLVGRSKKIDILKGTRDSDIFLVGDSNQTYYAEAGVEDYLLIKGFNLNQGDLIQLHGTATDYTVGTSSRRLPQGAAIFHQDELVAIVKGESFLNLDSSAFSFV